MQLVEAFGDEAGRPKQRTVATLGRLDAMGESVKSSVLNNSVFQVRLPGEVGVLQTVQLLAAARFGQNEA